jgi:hypothetical protein
MRKLLRDNGLSLALAAMFLLSLGGMIFTGRAAYNEELARHGVAGIDLLGYVRTGQFLSALAENWESEFLQMSMYVVLTAMLFQRGSAESRDPDKPAEPEQEPTWLQRWSPLSRWLYAHALGLVLAVLFAASFLLHFTFSLAAAKEEAALHAAAAPDLASYALDPSVWFESFQNWQSEFLATGLLVILSIFLRHRGSPESKSLAAPDRQPG